jgi:hypothetical protein
MGENWTCRRSRVLKVFPIPMTRSYRQFWEFTSLSGRLRVVVKTPGGCCSTQNLGSRHVRDVCRDSCTRREKRLAESSYNPRDTLVWNQSLSTRQYTLRYVFTNDRLHLHDLSRRQIIQVAGGAGAVSAGWVLKLRKSDGSVEMERNLTLPMEHITSLNFGKDGLRQTTQTEFRH